MVNIIPAEQQHVSIVITDIGNALPKYRAANAVMLFYFTWQSY